MDRWYFAYGSNLCTDQMAARTRATAHAEHPPRIARLADHRLVFQRLRNDGPAFANIVSPGEGVLGVLYWCSPAELARLDDFERGYERRPIVVADQHGEALAAVAYVMSRAAPMNLGQPSAAYLQRILKGARQHGLSESYIARIAEIACDNNKWPRQT